MFQHLHCHPQGYTLMRVSMLYHKYMSPEDDIEDVETCQGSNVNLKLHQKLML